MTKIKQLLNGSSTKDSIDALYYAVRYLRQVHELPEGFQEMFADDLESLPSKQARSLTEKLLRSIETRAGRPLAERNTHVRDEALNDLLAAAKRLDLGITPEREAAAKRWVEKNRLTGTAAQMEDAPLYAREKNEVIVAAAPVVASVAGYSSSR